MRDRDLKVLVHNEVDRYMDGVGGERGFNADTEFEHGEGENLYAASSDSYYGDAPTYTSYNIVYSTRKRTTVAKMARAIDELSDSTKRIELENRYLRDRVTILEAACAENLSLWRKQHE